MKESVATRWLAVTSMLALLEQCAVPAFAEGGKREEKRDTVHAQAEGAGMPWPPLRSAQKLASIRSQDQWHWIVPPNRGKRLDALAHGNNTFVALLNPGGTKVITPGRSTASTSHDGRKWSARELPADGIYHHLTYGNGLFVAVGRGAFGARGGKIIISRDGLHWTESATTRYDLTQVFYGDKRFIALGLRGTIVTSTNGVDWSESITESYGHLYAGAYGNGIFILVGDISLVTSPDASNWTHLANQDLGVPLGLRYITFGQGSFLLGGDQALFTSVDGTHWLRVTIDLPLKELVYTDNTFFVINEEDTVFTSADGTHWTQGPEVREDVAGLSCLTHHCSILGKRILVTCPKGG